MPKVKTNSGAKKRFTLTGTGKVKRNHAYHSHILTKKTKKAQSGPRDACRQDQPQAGSRVAQPPLNRDQAIESQNQQTKSLTGRSAQKKCVRALRR